MRIVITEFMDEAAVVGLAERFDVCYDKHLVDRPDELRVQLADADALIVRNRTSVDAALLTFAPQLRVVGRLGVGLDNIDMKACATRSIDVIPATGANALSVAEYVIATAMLLLRGAYGSTAEMTAGHWPRSALSSGRELSGKTSETDTSGTFSGCRCASVRIARTTTCSPRRQRSLSTSSVPRDESCINRPCETHRSSLV